MKTAFYKVIVFVGAVFFSCNNPEEAVQNDVLESESLQNLSRLDKVDLNENFIYFSRNCNNERVCIGLPGDTITIDGRQILVNGQPLDFSEEIKINYLITAINCETEELKKLFNQFGLNDGGLVEKFESGRCAYQYAMTKADANNLQKETDFIESVRVFPPTKKKDLNIFPSSNYYTWSKDYYGPLVVPKKGSTVKINSKIMHLYENIIRDYEGHTIYTEIDDVYIDEEKVDSYTFENDYYFLYSLNPDYEKDSRHWGVVSKEYFTKK
jgi:signal peptidase I